MKKHATKKTSAIPIYDDKCPLLRAIEIIEGKWKLPIIWFLSKKSAMRFNELQRHAVGVSHMMLAKCLREMEASGLVVRTEYNEVPPHVEYSLSHSGKALVQVLDCLYRWGEIYA
ncbi:MAG: helix-turn-helix transcriptional regulator [Desulfovibrionaceae bacterium]|nr:helix-turn-helix transcriptional regulator [Desulfovibrionaceae bacterium]